MKETEILGMIEASTFEAKVKEFTGKYGEAKIKKRLSIMLFDRNNPEVDTRIRITNGKPELMQKQKLKQEGINTTTKLELQVELLADTDQIFNLYKSFENVLLPYKTELVKLLVQTENYIWKIENIELKLSRQFGRSDFYTFEIELTEDGNSITQWQEMLNLFAIADLDSPEYSTYRSDKVDILIESLSEDQFREIISGYIN
ncbi:MAG: hypothetical protein Fur003_0820 [Candidatus Dojkabacteria bacterium]